MKKALTRINPEIAAQPERADEVIHKLRAVLLTVNQVGLVRANEDFARWLKGEITMPFGKDGAHVPVHLIDFDQPKNNTYLLTNQFKIRARETKIPDIVLFINGIPVVVGEAKTPVRPAVSWLDGAFEIHDVYENAVPALLVPTILNFATEGKEFRYGAVRTSLEFWCPWRLEDERSDLALVAGLQDVGKQMTNLLKPQTLLDILQHFTIYATNSKKRKIKVVARYQQYEGANAIVQRVQEGQIKKGLIWHFQGSGKSLLMVFAAQKLRKTQALKSPTVIIVVDRVDLDTQISGTFSAADVPNLVNADSISALHDLLERDTRKIIITMVYKFKDAYPDMNLRDNIILMVDEAHRTQEGDLGRKMRAALPNAFLFGLTGTPINRADKNTFWAFGAEQDASGYLIRYTFQDSIRDQQTLPLHFEPRLPNVHIDKDKQEKIVEQFNDAQSPLQFLIVTAKLLTGFDAPILQTLYLDKSLKDHTLLQAICRTNRLFPNKTFGRIVDYFGVFDDTAQALAFDEESVKSVVTNLQEMRDMLPTLVEKALAHFSGVNRTIEGFEGLSLAQDCLNDNERRDAFALDYVNLSKVWESLSPDAARVGFIRGMTSASSKSKKSP